MKISNILIAYFFMRKQVVVFLFFATLTAWGQKVNSVEILQVGLPSGHHVYYRYDGNTIMVTKGSKQKRVQIKKLTAKEQSQLDSLIDFISVDTLKESYIREKVFDGMRWTFTFHLDGSTKSIYLQNYYLRNLDIFLSHLNELLKPKNRLISFGDALYLKSDTLVLLMPDFFGNVQAPDSNYYEPSIQCINKQGFATVYADSARYCKCIIYAMFDKKDEYPRLDPWKAYNLGGYSWRVEYGNSAEEVRKGVEPLEFTNTSVEKIPGTVPSITITKYYRTTQVEEDR